ncbi:MAG: hypothetical protein MK212_05900 [Saprospiraceae bacterium]|nr:hypothetical protein [Saprospiraceae bacterium]
MKKLPIFIGTILLLLLNFSHQAQAQRKKHETLFSKVRIATFGGPTFDLANLKGRLSVSVGGQGGLMINGFSIGGYGMRSVSQTPMNIGGESYDTYVRHGGLLVGITPFSKKLIHPVLNARIGWGKATFVPNEKLWLNGQINRLVLFSPEAGFELNVARFFRIQVTGGYRFSNKMVVNPGLVTEEIDLNGVFASVTLKFSLSRFAAGR